MKIYIEKKKDREGNIYWEAFLEDRHMTSYTSADELKERILNCIEFEEI